MNQHHVRLVCPGVPAATLLLNVTLATYKVLIHCILYFFLKNHVHFAEMNRMTGFKSLCTAETNFSEKSKVN